MCKFSRLYHQSTFWIQSFLIFATILLLIPASTIFPLHYCRSFPAGRLCFCSRLSLYMLLSKQQPDRPPKFRADQVIPLLGPLPWLPVTLRRKSIWSLDPGQPSPFLMWLLLTDLASLSNILLFCTRSPLPGILLFLGNARLPAWLGVLT